MVLGRYLVCEYLDPWGLSQASGASVGTLCPQRHGPKILLCIYDLGACVCIFTYLHMYIQKCKHIYTYI